MTQSTLGSQSVDAVTLVKSFAVQLGTKVQDLEITQLAGDASSRRYFRIVKKSSPSKNFILQWAESLPQREIQRNAFLTGQANLKEIGIPVPEIFATDPENGWILMSDLSDEMLQGRQDLALYKNAVELMVDWTLKLHPSNTQLPSAVLKSLQFSWAFDFEKLDFEMGFAEEHFFGNLLEEPKLGKEFRKLSLENTKFLANVERFYCHRDYHCRNLMISDEKLCVIDFQDARMGPKTYDLVSLLWDPYVRLREDDRVELLQHWKNCLRESIKNAPWIQNKNILDESASSKNWQYEMERMKIQRLIKAVGSYASFFVVKKRKYYLPSIEPALEDCVQAFLNLEENFQHC